MFEVMDPKAVDLKLNGTTFTKEILKFGKFRHPNPKLTNDPKYNWEFTAADAEKLINNFKSKAVESVKLIDSHSEESGKRLGAIVDLKKTDSGVEAVIDVEDANVIAEIQTRTADGKPLAHGVSSGLDYGFPNSDATKPNWDGPVLRHVALVSIPWIQEMKDWEKVEDKIAASGGKFNFGHEDYSGTPLVPADEPKKPEGNLDLAATLASTLEVLNDISHKIDAKNSTEEKTEKDEKTAMSKEEIQAQVQEALAPILASFVPLTTQLKDANAAIEEDKKRREEENAQAAVTKLLSAGKILPKDKDTYHQMYLANPEMFEQIANTLPVQVTFDESTQNSDPFVGNPYSKNLATEEVETEVGRYLKLMTPMVAGRSDNLSRGE